MANPETLLQWLKEAGAYAFRCEDLERVVGVRQVDVLIQGNETIGVRVRSAVRQEYRSLTWSKLERAETNPLLQLIDEAINAVG